MCSFSSLKEKDCEIGCLVNFLLKEVHVVFQGVLSTTERCPLVWIFWLFFSRAKRFICGWRQCYLGCGRIHKGKIRRIPLIPHMLLVTGSHPEANLYVGLPTCLGQSACLPFLLNLVIK